MVKLAIRTNFLVAALMTLAGANTVLAAEVDSYKKTGVVAGEIRSVQYHKDRVELEIHAPDSTPAGEKAHVSFTATFWTDEAAGGAGRYEDRGGVYGGDGEATRFFSSGIWKRVTKKGDSNHRWTMKTLGVIGDGGTYFATGVFDQKTMTFKAEVYETGL